jgi:ATP-dependent helicase/DNAse subunit B
LTSTTHWPAKLDNCQEVLDGALHDIEEHYLENLLPRSAGFGELRSRRFVQIYTVGLKEAAKQNEWKPEYFELGFGLPAGDDRDPSSFEEPVTLKGGVLIRGAIDLVERHTTRGTLRVVDHKTGKTPDHSPLGKGFFTGKIMKTPNSTAPISVAVSLASLRTPSSKSGLGRSAREHCET